LLGARITNGGDTYFAGEFAQLAADIQQLAGRFQAIRDSFCPNGGVVDFNALLAVKATLSQADQDALTATMAEALIARMLGDGNPDWALIEQFAGLSYAQWTDAIGIALAGVYIGLDTRHLERFINALAEQIELSDPNMNWGLFHLPADALHADGNALWRFCADKIASLQRHLEGAIDLLLVQQKSATNDEIADAIQATRHELQQRSALLTAVVSLTPIHDLGPMMDMWNGVDDRFSNQQRGFVIFGTADSPGIQISQREDGTFTLAAQRVAKSVNIDIMRGAWDNSVPVGGHSHDEMTLRNLHVETVTISTVVEGTVDAAIEVINQARTVELQNHQFNAGEHLLTAGASIALGAIPGIGGVIGAADAVNPFGAIQQQSAARDSINAVADAGITAARVAGHDLDMISITNGDGTFSVQAWPSPSTAERIAQNQRGG